MDFQLKKLDTVITVSEIANVHFFDFPKGYETIDDQHPFCELIYVGTGSIDVHSDEYSGKLKKRTTDTPRKLQALLFLPAKGGNHTHYYRVYLSIGQTALFRKQAVTP